MTTKVEAYNELIEIGENTYLDYQRESPEALKVVEDAYQFHIKANGIAKSAAGPLMQTYDTLKPDNWQIGLALHFVRIGIKLTKDYLLREGLISTLGTSGKECQEVVRNLPDDVKGQLVGELQLTFMELLADFGCVTDSLLTPTGVATSCLCRVFDAGKGFKEASDKFVHKHVPEELRKEFEVDAKRVTKHFAKTAKGFKN